MHARMLEYAAFGLDSRPTHHTLRPILLLGVFFLLHLISVCTPFLALRFRCDRRLELPFLAVVRDGLGGPGQGRLAFTRLRGLRLDRY